MTDKNLEKFENEILDNVEENTTNKKQINVKQSVEEMFFSFHFISLIVLLFLIFF